ncbi:MAG TPA: zinc-regulated TonB-dependent outer membrane receptor, partial [Myxococcaceae bacterium]|nr:zinc-regulated TonB-dependent outer membrane receptor [Myxococcaceae bacterium]
EAIQRSLSSDAPARGSNATPPAPPPQTPAPRGFSLQSLNPDLSFIADVAGAWFSKGEPFQTGGHDPTERGFNLQALEMAVSKAVDPFFRFDANFAFSQEGVEIEEAYATSLSFPFRTQLRVGQFLTRFGRINNTHPHTWAFVDQPFAIGRVFGGDGNRGLGAELSWLTPLPWYVELVGSVTDARGENTARSFFGAEPLPLRSPLDLQITGALKQFFAVSDDLSLLWGLSTAAGPNSTGGERNRTDVYGTDLYLKFRPISDPSNPTIVSLQVEALYRRRQIPDALLRDLNGYAEIFWRFEPRWGIASRYEMGTGDDLFREPAVEDPLDPDWGRLRQRVSANVTFWPTEFSRVRLQGASSVIDTAARPEYSLFLAFEFAVGAHGAHVF